MGSPLSGFIAEAVLQKLETCVLTNHRPIFWARYVDETFVILKVEMASEFHALLTSVYLGIQFTMDAEVNSQMAFIERNRRTRQVTRPKIEQPKVWRVIPYIEDIPEAVARLLLSTGIGVAHKPEATIRCLVMRPKALLSSCETVNFVFCFQCGSSEVNDVGETGKRLQTRMIERARAIRRMDQLSFVTEHCAVSGHTFALQDTEILSRGIGQTARETLEALHTIPISINRCTIVQVTYQAQRKRLNQRNHKREVRLVAVASKSISSKNRGLSEPMPHTNAFISITAKNENQQDLRSGEHSLCMITNHGRLQSDRSGDWRRLSNHRRDVHGQMQTKDEKQICGSGTKNAGDAD
ncbi:unnamed protein product [Schistocephalus solidus]|uniref:Reverse transcriptase domain-containing protein n=1 Tax=Schistocephalus solidus TaxID=70667 RepID=A0A183TKH7_SCHSO|nr:unnamed protein product [Schistocephalus solidus]